MNSNNKFGKCCNCPAFMSDSRLFTNWETSKTFNYNLGLELNTNTNTEYKEFLIKNPGQINNIFYKDISTCNNNDELYVDSSLYHQKFTKNILNEMYRDITVRPFYSLEFANK